MVPEDRPVQGFALFSTFLGIDDRDSYTSLGVECTEGLPTMAPTLSTREIEEGAGLVAVIVIIIILVMVCICYLMSRIRHLQKQLDIQNGNISTTYDAAFDSSTVRDDRDDRGLVTHTPMYFPINIRDEQGIQMERHTERL